MTGQQWVRAIKTAGTIYDVDVFRLGSSRATYWKNCIGAPIGTRVVVYPGIDFGMGRYHCHASLLKFKEYCEAAQTMACTCGGVCRVVQMIRVARGLGGSYDD